MKQNYDSKSLGGAIEQKKKTKYKIGPNDRQPSGDKVEFKDSRAKQQTRNLEIRKKLNKNNATPENTMTIHSRYAKSCDIIQTLLNGTTIKYYIQLKFWEG